jgi:hypothetical protein
MSERGNKMVRKRAENGSFYHEPPYTEEEELDLYRRMASGPKIARQSRPPSAPEQISSKRKSELLPEEKEIIAALEKSRGCPLTEHDINLALDQARAIGEL